MAVVLPSTAFTQFGVSGESAVWKDIRVHSISMIGLPGVPIPLHRTTNYRVTTGSEAKDRELRRMVSLEINEATSPLVPIDEDSPSALRPSFPTLAREPTTRASAKAGKLAPHKLQNPSTPSDIARHHSARSVRQGLLFANPDIGYSHS